MSAGVVQPGTNDQKRAAALAGMANAARIANQASIQPLSDVWSVLARLCLRDGLRRCLNSFWIFWTTLIDSVNRRAPRQPDRGLSGF
jgi:hypothetical protein